MFSVSQRPTSSDHLPGFEAHVVAKTIVQHTSNSSLFTIFLDSPAVNLYILVQERVFSTYFKHRALVKKGASMKKKPKKDEKKGPKKGK